MGNSSSHKRTKTPNQTGEDRPPDLDKACHKQFFSHLKRKKPSTKIVLVFPLDKRQQVAEATGPCARPGWLDDDVVSALAGSPVAAPMLRGAGDGVDRREGSRAREMKRILVLLLQLDARLQEEGRRAAGGLGGAADAKAAPAWHLLTQGQADREDDPREAQPRRRRRSPRPWP